MKHIHRLVNYCRITIVARTGRGSKQTSSEEGLSGRDRNVKG